MILKPEECRIGNIVLDNYTKLIRAITIDDFKRQAEDGRAFQYFQPVPLAEDWLYKNGFFDSDPFAEFLKVYGNDFCRLTKNDDNIWTYWPEALYGFNLDFKFIHQLQNIYFYIQGNELIKP